VNDEYPRIVTADELRFDINFALGQMPRILLREWAGKNDMKSDHARQMMTARILEQLSRYQVRARPPLPSMGDSQAKAK
jgi:hypothetical protein